MAKANTKQGVSKPNLTTVQPVITDEVQFSLPKKQWKEFYDALDAPTKTIPALRRLLNEPGLFNTNR